MNKLKFVLCVILLPLLSTGHAQPKDQSVKLKLDTIQSVNEAYGGICFSPDILKIWPSNDNQVPIDSILYQSNLQMDYYYAARFRKGEIDSITLSREISKGVDTTGGFAEALISRIRSLYEQIVEK